MTAANTQIMSITKKYFLTSRDSKSVLKLCTDVQKKTVTVSIYINSGLPDRWPLDIQMERQHWQERLDRSAGLS